MGDPHQAYLVARLPSKDNKGSRGSASYRCVAALYHHSCYSIEVLSAIRRFIILAQQPDNAEIIRDELRRAGDAQREEGFKSEYLGKLLACAYYVGLEEEPICGGWYNLDDGILDVNMNCRDEDVENHHGQSIIDITNLDKCAYALIPGEQTLQEGEDRNVLMNAREYATAYEILESLPDDDWQLDVQPAFVQPILPVQLKPEAEAAIALLRNVPLLESWVLSEAWPEDFWYPLPRYRGPAQADGLELPPKDKVSTMDVTPTNATPIVPPLSELALRLTLSQSLGNHSIETLRSLMWLPGKVETFLEAFRSPQFVPFPDSALDLLADATGLTCEEDTMDLSGVCLSDEQILSLTRNTPGVQTLKLSHNPSVTIRTVQVILTSLPNIKRLVLLNTAISPQEWVSLLQEHPSLFYNLDALAHPSLLDADNAFFPDAFTIIGNDETTTCTETIPFFSNNTLAQVLTKYLHTLARNSIIGSAGIAATILSAEALKPGQTWGSRSIPAFSRSISIPFEGNGWAFIFCAARNQFGFAKVTRGSSHTHDSGGPSDGSSAASAAQEDLTCNIHDLTSFLSELEKEGRPPMAEDIVEELTNLFKNATQHTLFGQGVKLKLMSAETAKDVMRGELIDNWQIGIVQELLSETSTSTHIDLQN